MENNQREIEHVQTCSEVFTKCKMCRSGEENAHQKDRFQWWWWWWLLLRENARSRHVAGGI